MEAYLEESGRIRFAVFLGLIAAIALFYVRALAHFDYTPDDTYVFLRTAENIANGDGFAFNFGEKGVSVTSPLWTLLIAAASAVDIDPYIAAKGLDLVFASLALLSLMGLIVELTEDRAFAVIGVVIFSLDAWHLRWAGSGMETSLATLLTLVTIRHALKGDLLTMATSGALLVLVRPENLVLLGLIFGLRPWEDRRPWRKLVAPGVVAGGILLSWVVVSWVVTGSPISNTLAAKASRFLSWPGMLAASWDSLRIAVATQAGSCLFVALGVVTLRRYLSDLDWLRLALLVGWPMMLAGSYTVQGDQVISRFLAPSLPLLLVAAIWMIARNVEEKRLSTKLTMALPLCLGFFVGAPSQALYALNVVPHMRDSAENVQHAYRPMAYWILHNTSTDARILTPDVGVVAYVGRRKVWDPAGLLTTSLRRRVEGITYDEIMTRGLYRDVIVPDFVIDRAAVPERLRSDSLRPIMSAQLSSLGQSNEGTRCLTLYEVLR